jgi:hypothetical protein
VTRRRLNTTSKLYSARKSPSPSSAVIIFKEKGNYRSEMKKGKIGKKKKKSVGEGEI